MWVCSKFIGTRTIRDISIHRSELNNQWGKNYMDTLLVRQDRRTNDFKGFYSNFVKDLGLNVPVVC